MEIVTQYSLWWMLPIVLISLGLSVLLYYRNAREHFPLWANFVLGFFRFFAFTLLGFLLLSPMLKNWKTEIQKPIIILLQDESESIVLNGDSTFYKNEYIPKVEKLISQMQDKADVKVFSFAESLNSGLHNSYNGLNTNISHALNSINDQYGHLNIGAVIMATDGLYNRGQNPYYATKKMKFPIYFIALGDTVLKSDLMINRKAYNRTAFLGNKFPIEVEVISRKAKGAKSVLQLLHKGKVIEQKKISISTDNQKDIIRFYPQAKKSGMQSYQLRLKTIENEENVYNNTARIYVNVIDSKKKILILYDSPHPDVSAIKSALIDIETYEVEAIQFNKFKKNIKAYNLVIMHQLPNVSRTSFQLIKKMKLERIPFLLVMGENTFLPNFNKLHLGFEIQNQKMSLNTVLANNNSNFAAFTISSALKSSVKSFPPLSSPYGKYRVSKAMQVLYYQQIGSVSTEIPLVGIINQSGWRTAYILGEGLWRWRIYDYRLNSNHDVFNELITKIVRYLSLDKQQSDFDIEVKEHFDEMEEVKFNAVVYNDSYEPIVENDIELSIKDEEGKEYNYTFSKLDSSYYLSVGRLNAGIYHYKARVKKGVKQLQRKGSFMVQSTQLEALQLTADHHLLQLIADEHDAKVFFANETSELANSINERDDIVSIEYNQLKYQDLIDLPWIGLIIVILLGLEWFARKQFGSY